MVVGPWTGTLRQSTTSTVIHTACRSRSARHSTRPTRFGSCAEQYSQLVKAVGGLQEAVGLSIGPNYRSTCHIAAIDLEKVSGATPAGGKAAFTGISTKNSGEIRVVYEDVSAHVGTWLREVSRGQVQLLPVADVHLLCTTTRPWC
jgi:hypothetical protein